MGLAGLLLTMYTGDGSAVEVAKCQPMKLAAMEGLYDGSHGQDLIAVGVLNPAKRHDNMEDPYLFEMSLPKGLSLLANHDTKSFVPGINDLINGISFTPEGDTIYTVSYADRILRGKAAHAALRRYDAALTARDSAAMAVAESELRADYPFFGYGYFDSVEEAIPPVAVTFYSFRVMVTLGGYFLFFFFAALVLVYRIPSWLQKNWVLWIAIISVPVMWVCSEAGWVVAEVGRQPWTVQDLLPTRAAVSAIGAGSVMTTFWMFAAVFTILLVAELSIMGRQINRAAKETII